MAGTPGTALRTEERRLPVLILSLFALALYSQLPASITFLPSWLVPAVGVLVLVPLVLLNPRRISTETRWSRWVSVGFAVGLALINQVYIVMIVQKLVAGEATGPAVLLIAFQVWITNVIAYALVYWELDKGGPVARRVEGVRDAAQQDFRFPQQDNTTGVEGWAPGFIDYAYFSLSNMMAFSPTDVMPLTQRAKALMGLQALTGFVLLALVISRAVNILT